MTRALLSRRSFMASAACLPLLACGEAPDLLIVPEAAGLGSSETVFVATNRVYANGAFQEDRQEYLSFARFDVNVPSNRLAGAVNPARNGPRGPNLQSDFVASSGETLGGDRGFRDAVIAEAQRRGTQEVMVFIHGFNNTFGSGLYRTAQIRHDFDIPGIAVHYAWPSAAHPLWYAYDRDSALFARDGLEDLITQITDTGLNVVLVAHSLGSAVVMELLRQLRIGRREDVIDHINGVILFSPDIDVDVFRSQAMRIGELPQPFVIFTSQRDRALGLSARITGSPARVGNLGSAEQVADFEVTMVDVSEFQGGTRDPFNHFAGATSPAVVQMLRDVNQVNQSFEQDPTQLSGLIPGTVLIIQNATQVILSPPNLR